jgi:hypothetical protein
MTIRDYRSIHTLYFFHRYIPSSIARLYGVSPKHIIEIIEQKQDETVISEVECQICGIEDDILTFYIDGDSQNNKPQNIIMLCEPDRRKFQHMQLRRRQGTLKPQMES